MTGRIQTRNYENQEGRRVYLTEVVAENFERLEKRDDTANRSNIEEQMPGYVMRAKRREDNQVFEAVRCTQETD